MKTSIFLLLVVAAGFSGCADNISEDDNLELVFGSGTTLEGTWTFGGRTENVQFSINPTEAQGYRGPNGFIIDKWRNEHPSPLSIQSNWYWPGLTADTFSGDGRKTMWLDKETLEPLQIYSH